MTQKVGLIVAANQSGLIGLNGSIPWRSSPDMKRFKAVTMGGALIMGRLTWETLPRPLVGRHCIIISSNPSALQNKVGAGDDAPMTGVGSLSEAISVAHTIGRPIWVAGGGKVYSESLQAGVVDFIDFTSIREDVVVPEGSAATYFSLGVMAEFEIVEHHTNPDDPRLTHFRYTKKG